MEDLRRLKDENPESKLGVSHNPGSILNGYREGDLTFSDAKEMIVGLTGDQKRPELDMNGVMSLMTTAFEARSRSEIWDYLYGTEFEGQSMELNEAMACMTDEEVYGWFPKVFTEYLLKELNLL